MPYLVGVRERRRKTGVKVGAFVEPLPCSRSHLMSIENTSRPASPELTELIADRLTQLGVKTSAEDLTGKEAEPTPAPDRAKRVDQRIAS